jgi:hypothetical protein
MTRALLFRNQPAFLIIDLFCAIASLHLADMRRAVRVARARLCADMCVRRVFVIASQTRQSHRGDQGR